MKVLITGVAGFLGTHVAQYYRNLGHEVVGIDNLTDYELKRTTYDVKASRKHNLEFLESIDVEFRKLDILDAEASDFPDIDFIVHCAAQPAMTIAIEDPKLDMMNNVAGTLNILCLAKDLKVPIVVCSSIHMYGNKLNEELREEGDRFVMDPPEITEDRPILQGQVTPLHASKGGVELYARAFIDSYGLKAAIFRLTGMYGERQFGGMDHGWVANFAIRTVMHRPITVFGTDKQVRDILYAEDAARAFDMWFTNGQTPGIYNIGGGMRTSISIKECLDQLRDLSGDSQSINLEPKRLGDLHYFVCNYSKAKETFGWEPKILPVEGLTNLLNWIKENKEIL